MKRPDVLSYFRPRWWPLLAAHSLCGFAVMERDHISSIGWEGWLAAIAGAAMWAILLCGPASALACVFAPAPEGRPKEEVEIAWAAIIMLVLGLPLALLLPLSWGYWDAWRVGIVLAALYAAPPVRLGRFPVAAALIEALGLGALTFCSGMVVMDRPLPISEPSLGFWFIAFISLYLAAKLAASDQQERSTPWLFWSALGVGFAALVAAGGIIGNGWSSALLLAPLCVWCIAGLDRFDKGYRERSGAGMTLAGAWLLTDVAVAFAATMR